ncbi:MAG TPA: hypothetical protein VGY53_13380 [Isosphaeraceae bacterium]|nr:hypothetical protein [Isosphaeraceae bacterium]
MSPQDLRAKVAEEALRDATAYFQEFCRPFDVKDTLWGAAAWTDLRRDLSLAPNVADELWPEYWETFRDETVRLAASSGQ